MPGSPARNDLTTLFNTTISTLRISFVDLQLLLCFNSQSFKENMAGMPVHGIPMDTKRRAGMVRHDTLQLHGHSASVCVREMG